MLNSLKLILENESSDEPIKIGQFKKTGKMSLEKKRQLTIPSIKKLLY